MSCLIVLGVDDGRIKDPENQTPELAQKWHKMGAMDSHQTEPSLATIPVDIYCGKTEPTPVTASVGNYSIKRAKTEENSNSMFESENHNIAESVSSSCE